MKLRQVYFGLIAIAGVALTDLSFAQQQVEIRGPKDATEQYSGATYGPIQSSDTLWRIANRYRQNKNLTIYQVMQAIYDLNPEAFEGNNFNQLKNGAVLRLPSERYVARVDAQDAKDRAELDDLNWQPRAGADSSVPATPRSPAETLASKDDLSQTKEDLEKKLVAIDEEQNRQFQAIRQQFAESINSVQTLLDENQKLYDRLDVVNQDIEGLRTRVDEELKIQIDQVLDIQNELLAISKEAEAQRQAEMQKSSFDFLTDPLTMIIGSVIITLSFLGGLTFWLLKRRNTEPVAEQPVMQAPVEAPLTEQTSEIDDLTDALSNELSDELDEDLGGDDLFGEDDLLDDVLSDELQESLDEALDEELESFDDLGDEMLVPEAEKSDSPDEEGEAVLEQGELDSLFEDDADISDLEDEMDAIDLSDTDELTDDLAEDAGDELDQLLEESDLDDLLDESVADMSELDGELEQATDALDEQPGAAEEVDLEAPLEQPEEGESLASVEDEQEKPEISIDELLEEPEPAVPETIDVDDGETISEEMLQQLDKEIATQNQELDNITDELINEIEQLEMMGDMLPPEDEEPQESAEQQHGIQQLDDLSEDIDSDLAEDTNDEQDALADELLAEMGVDVDEEPEPAAAADQQDDLADELLAELGVEPEDSVSDSGSGSGDEQAQRADQQDELADELLAELGVDTEAVQTDAVEADAQEDLADELLQELGVEDSDEPEAQPQTDSQDDLAQELLDELEEEETETAEDPLAAGEPIEGDPIDADFDSVELTGESDASEQPESEVDAQQLTDAEPEVETQPETDQEAEQATETENEPSTAVESEEPEDADIASDTDLAEKADDAETSDESDALSSPLAEDDEIESEDIADDLLDEDSVEPELEQDMPEVVDEVAEEPEVEPATLASDDLDTSESAEVDEQHSEPVLTDNDIEESSVDELLQELEEEPQEQHQGPESDLNLDDELDIPSFTEVDEQPQNAEDEFDKALDDFEQELGGDHEIEPEPQQVEDALPESTEDIDLDDLTEDADIEPVNELVADLPGLDDIDSITDFDDSELEKALDSYAEDHQELALEDEPKQSDKAQQAENLDDVPGLDDWLGGDSDEDALDDSLLEELENTSFDELLDNIEDKSEEQTAEQDALLDNPDLDLEALLTEDDTLDELDVELAENEVEQPEDDFLDVDSLLNESIEAESEPLVEKDLDLDVSLEEFTGVSSDDDTVDVDSDQGLGAKMDLARAYLEIEDNDSARDLLKEIAEEGDDEQKAEAQELLNSL